MRLSEREFAQMISNKQEKSKGLKEIDIQNAIRDYLRWQGWYVLRHQQGLGSQKGLSDLSAIKEGWTVYIEAKTKAGKLSKDQEDFRDELIAHGGTYIVARSVEDVTFLCEGTVVELKIQWQGKGVGN